MCHQALGFVFSQIDEKNRNFGFSFVHFLSVNDWLRSPSLLRCGFELISRKSLWIKEVGPQLRVFLPSFPPASPLWCSGILISSKFVI